MKTTHPVESVLGNRSRVAVLRVLNGVRVPLNASQVAARAGLSQPAAAKALADLAAAGVADSSSAGRATVHWLVRENVFVQRMVEPVFAAEQAIPELMLADLARAFAGAASVVLFGSYARGQQRDSSDVDVVVVAPEGTPGSQLEDVADEYAGVFRRRFGASLSVLTYEMREAASLWRRSPQLQDSIERDAITVTGMPPREWRSADESS